MTVDTIRLVRAALRDQDDEIKQMKWKREEQDLLMSDMQNQLTRSEDAQKAAKREFSDAERELETLFVFSFKIYFF